MENFSVVLVTLLFITIFYMIISSAPIRNHQILVCEANSMERVRLEGSVFCRDNKGNLTNIENLYTIDGN